MGHIEDGVKVVQGVRKVNSGLDDPPKFMLYRHLMTTIQNKNK